MKINSTRIVLAINVLFFMISIMYLTNIYFSGVEKFYKADEMQQIAKEIKSEIKIEKLREFALLSIETDSSAWEMTNGLLYFLKIFLLTFCGVAGINIYYLYTRLKQKRDLTCLA